MNTNRAFNTIYTNIKGDIENPRIACFVKGQMQMALQCGAIDKAQYRELNELILQRYGYNNVISGQLYKSNDIYWNCYLARDEKDDLYYIVVDMDDSEDIDAGAYELSDIFVALDIEELAGYEFYDDNGDIIDLRSINE